MTGLALLKWRLASVAPEAKSSSLLCNFFVSPSRWGVYCLTRLSGKSAPQRPFPRSCSEQQNASCIILWGNKKKHCVLFKCLNLMHWAIQYIGTKALCWHKWCFWKWRISYGDHAAYNNIHWLWLLWCHVETEDVCLPCLFILGCNAQIFIDLCYSTFYKPLKLCFLPVQCSLVTESWSDYYGHYHN